ncbi:hypothetical protein BG07_1444 [Bacillus pseudomycoides]|uniref:hypothetical protein n=1 Tax=Bacillus pseudomycoides TaxID=64104 RepID=UPI0004ED85BC|nr:hypothetical protein [Bacillus pseudomycoides]AIK39317.1 hypothetical protein DJ92_3500 [Bacillus pseudomycoides]AJI19475.1 hypothetical protein BG07_1444 [Bacillus pseudomycoides]
MKKDFFTLRDNVLDNGILSVLVHELCKADFLARRLPIAVNKREDEIIGRIIELFSHPHCRKLAESFGLEEIEGLYRKDAIEICIRNLVCQHETRQFF